MDYYEALERAYERYPSASLEQIEEIAMTILEDNHEDYFDIIDSLDGIAESLRNITSVDYLINNPISAISVIQQAIHSLEALSEEDY